MSEGQVERIAAASERALQGNLASGGEKLAAQHKLFVRERIDLLCDHGTFVEDQLLANAAYADGMDANLPADGVVTGVGEVDGRPVCIMANDPTVKAGSWGARTVEKIVRLTETALRDELPVVWLVDSAGARITDQVELFPGRRGAGRIFYNQVRLSGKVPQVCCLFGPSAAGGAYIPAFTDLVIMVEGNASMYLGSPRMAEMVIGEVATLEETGGARMHATVSGCGDNLADDDEDAIAQARAYLTYLPSRWSEPPPQYQPVPPARDLTADIVPAEETMGYDMHDVLDGLLDEESFFEVKPLFAPEMLTGFGLLEGRPVGIVANNPMHKGGVHLHRLRRQGGSLHLAVRRVRRAADLPGRRARLHDRDPGRARGHHPPRSEDDHRRVRGDRAEDLGGRAQGVRRRAVRDERAGLRTRGDPGAADGEDRGDGPRGRRERRVRQQDRRDRGRGRARWPSSRSSAGSTRRTSICCAWRPSSSSTRSSTGRRCGPRSTGAWCAPRARAVTSRHADTACRRSEELPVPWCEDCDRFYTPSTLTEDGDCPQGHHVADPEDAPQLVQSSAEGREEEPDPKVPWHFWLLIIATVIYLGYRAFQGLEWVLHR